MRNRVICLLGTLAMGLVTVTVGAEPPATIIARDGARMALVPAGPFMMGSGEGREDEVPPHRVDVSAFYMDVTEVTVAQYARFVQETGHAPPPDWVNKQPPAGRETRPMTNVSWYDAMRYAIWAGKRLPTEAEWEKAARGTDGRRYPWGNDEDKKRAVLEGAKLRPVGGLPQGASPYGCLDMAGNAWEWTADWYQAYPGASMRTLAFGRKYKVMRGSGAEYFYSLNENTGRCSLRGRILPYACEDYLGFRCAQDVDPAGKPAYDAKKWLDEAEAQLKGSLREPLPLSYEKEFDGYRKAGNFAIHVTGQPNQSGYVRAGVPFPAGLLKNPATIRVLGPDGGTKPIQTTVLTPWKDGSTRWMLLDFPATAGEECRLVFNAPANPPTTATKLKIQKAADELTVDTGVVVLTFAKDSLLREIRTKAGTVLAPMTVDLVLESADKNGPAVRLRPMPAEQLGVEESGPLHTTVRLQGSFADNAGHASPFKYDVRAQMVSGSARANLLVTVAHMQPRTGKDEDRTPMAKVKDFSVRFALADPPAKVVFATDRGTKSCTVGKQAELAQTDHLRYAISQDGNAAAEGTRCPGWVAVPSRQDWIIVGVRHFWQAAPKAIVATPKDLTLRLWSGQESLEWEATLARTHEIVLDLAAAEPRAVNLDPLRITMPPAWACGTEALGGPALPRSPESIGRFPYWELLRELGMRNTIRDMRFGFRDFGDTRHGGETKGKNASHNLEYDEPFNFLLQYLRTAQTWYLDTAEVQTRHQADIDTDHVTGHPYKHSPFHTTWKADLAHQFLRGMVAHYWLTGERRSLEVARKIGDHIAGDAEKNAGVGNERQIGWCLYALSGIYDATLDERYLKAASSLCNTLVSGQSPTGKFNIRYDNRMSLMNGMAMNGLMSVQLLNGDEKLAEAILRLARRTLGFYPEYACRTLHGYGWALRRTNDPKYRDVLERTWESCLEYLTRGAAADEVHAWHFTWFAAKYDMMPLFDRVPEQLPDAATWRCIRLDGQGGELFLKNAGTVSAPVLTVLHGMADGEVELFDAAGVRIQRFDLKDVGRLYQPAAFCLPAGSGVCRLRLSASRAIAWQIHHDARSRITVYSPKFEHVAGLYPAAYGCLAPNAKEVTVKLEAIGEGFHAATLFDPDGHVAATVEHFVDLDDKGRYEVELKAPIADARREGWSLQINESKVLSITGMLPYWSCGADQWFSPERATK